MKTLKANRISRSQFDTIVYRKGFKPQPFQEIKENDIEKRIQTIQYSYHGTNKFFAIVIREDGETSYLINCKVSDKTPTHAALQAHFNL